jgi:hypothetical protein
MITINNNLTPIRRLIHSKKYTALHNDVFWDLIKKLRANKIQKIYSNHYESLLF